MPFYCGLGTVVETRGSRAADCLIGPTWSTSRLSSSVVTTWPKPVPGATPTSTLEAGALLHGTISTWRHISPTCRRRVPLRSTAAVKGWPTICPLDQKSCLSGRRNHCHHGVVAGSRQRPLPGGLARESRWGWPWFDVSVWPSLAKPGKAGVVGRRWPVVAALCLPAWYR